MNESQLNQKKIKDSTQIQLAKAKKLKRQTKTQMPRKIKKTLIKRIALIINRNNSHILDTILLYSGQKKAKLNLLQTFLLVF
jgi:hypothetical protein